MHIRTLQFRIAGMGESDVDALTSPVYTKYANPVTTILAKPGDVELHFRARAATPEAAQALLDEIGPQIEALLGDRIYSRNGDPLEAAVGARLRERAATLATAESCSGGLLAERITSVAGSSDYFLGGFVAYSAAMKESALGVDGAGLLEHGVYSDWTAQAMAEGARARTGATYGIGITGVAGPGPDGETPPGTVYIAASGPDKFTARKLHLFGDRDRVRFMATQSALDLLRKEFLL
jgi:nicotinamide-nucleotide amidase